MQDGSFGVMNIMDHTGHSEIKWDRSNPTEVQTARDMFDAMRAKGHSIFKIGRNNSQGERVSEFDPAAEKYMVVPQHRGG